MSVVKLVVRLTVGEVWELAHVFRQLVMNPEYDGSDGRRRSTIYAILKTAVQNEGVIYGNDRIRGQGWYGPRNLSRTKEIDVEFPAERLGDAQLLTSNLVYLMDKRRETPEELRTAAKKMESVLFGAGYTFTNGVGWHK